VSPLIIISPKKLQANVDDSTKNMSKSYPPPVVRHAPYYQLTPDQVLEYLSKKGYTRTEATLRRESRDHDPITGQALSSKEPDDAEQLTKGYEQFRSFVDDSLELYRPEFSRLLWPLFVYGVLKLADDYYTKGAESFFKLFNSAFAATHPDDVRALSTITNPSNVETSPTAQLYLRNKYRITLTPTAQTLLYQFLEAKEVEGTKLLTFLLQRHFHIVTVNRAQLGNERSLSALLGSGGDAGDLIPEDEGIPGHNPGSANTDPNAPSTLPKLRLGALPPHPDMMEDIHGELEDEDKRSPPAPGVNSLVDEYEQQIKREPNEDGPLREQVPLPPPLARDVAMEVQKIRELRDRFKIDPRTGGLGPGVSVVMYTFHNSHDSITCLDFSGDLLLVAAGTSEHYIRIWSLDGKPLPIHPDFPTADNKPVASRKLIGHFGPVYAVSFPPATTKPSYTNAPETRPRTLLSCSEDKTIRLWSLESYATLVIYKGHNQPVWDVRWSPMGHYFLSCGRDRTARLWSTDSISSLRQLVGHEGDVEQVAWHPNGTYVFTAGSERSVRAWDLQRGTGVRMFTGHLGNVTALECAPNGKVLASGDDTGAIFLWDLESGRRIKRMRGHGKGGIWSLVFAMESTVLVSGGADCTVRVWDVEQKSGDAAKAIDGAAKDGAAGTGTAGGAAASVVGSQKKKKDAGGATPDQISVFPTKQSPVYKVMFTRSNLVLSGSAYLPERF
jgi:transcription initiation factor TFIID subunit 5